MLHLIPTISVESWNNYFTYKKVGVRGDFIICPAPQIGNARAEFQPGLFWFAQTHTHGSVTLIT